MVELNEEVLSVVGVAVSEGDGHQSLIAVEGHCSRIDFGKRSGVVESIKRGCAGLTQRNNPVSDVIGTVYLADVEHHLCDFLAYHSCKLGSGVNHLVLLCYFGRIAVEGDVLVGRSSLFIHS